jgi:hypothetical protein
MLISISRLATSQTHGSEAKSGRWHSTSIFGSFLGADASPRALQIKKEIIL